MDTENDFEEKITKLYPMNTISSDNKNEVQFFMNHLPYPWI